MLKVIEVLNHVKPLRVADSLEYLYKLAAYQGSARAYRFVREQASEGIKGLFTFRWWLPYAAYAEALTRVKNWACKDTESDLFLVELLEGLLKVQVDWVELAPSDNRQGIFATRFLLPAPSLRELRNEVLVRLRCL